MASERKKTRDLYASVIFNMRCSCHQSNLYMVIVRSKYNALIAYQLLTSLAEVNKREFVVHTQSIRLGSFCTGS
jgi:hypothetical protein